MVKPFIKVTKDFYKRGDCDLYAFRYLGECHTFFLMLTMAEYSGEKRGTVTTTIEELAAKACVTKAKMNQWIRTLKDKGLISTQRINKTDVLVTINEFDAFNGKNTYSPHSDATDTQTQDINNVDVSDASNDTKTTDNPQTHDRHPFLSSDSDNLEASKNKEYRTKNSTSYSSLTIKEKEKKKNNIKRKKEKFGGRPEAVAAIAGDLSKFVAYAQSKSDEIDISPMWVEREFEKWSNWMDANNKTYSNYNKAFSNWILNAIAYQMERQPKRGTRLEDIPLLSADDYS